MQATGHQPTGLSAKKDTQNSWVTIKSHVIESAEEARSSRANRLGMKMKESKKISAVLVGWT